MHDAEDFLIGAERWKLAAYNVLRSSNGRSWSGIAAETRRTTLLNCRRNFGSHRGRRPEVIRAPCSTGAAMAFGRPRRLQLGRFGLCPEEVAEDGICITGFIPETLHISLDGQFTFRGSADARAVLQRTYAWNWHTQWPNPNGRLAG